jgi:hypothetical protein
MEYYYLRRILLFTKEIIVYMSFLLSPIYYMGYYYVQRKLLFTEGNCCLHELDVKPDLSTREIIFYEGNYCVPKEIVVYMSFTLDLISYMGDYYLRRKLLFTKGNFYLHELDIGPDLLHSSSLSLR